MLQKLELASKFASYINWLNTQRLGVLRKLTALQAAQKPFQQVEHADCKSPPQHY